MIRVLKNADFSNCGLGKIDIPVPATQESVAVAAKFTGLTEENEAKLKSFIDKLVYHGIYGKLSYLAIPYLASSLSEALMNVMLENGVPQPTAPSNMAFTAGHGLYLNDKYSINPFNLKTYWKTGVGGEVGKFSMGVCIEYKDGWDKTGGPYLQRRPSYSSDFGQIKPANSSTPGLFGGFNSITGNYKVYIFNNATGIQMLSCDVDEEYAFVLGENGNIATIDFTSNRDESNTPGTPYGTFLGGNGSISHALDYFRLFFDGEPLTSQEMEIMRDEIKKLCDW